MKCIWAVSIYDSILPTTSLLKKLKYLRISITFAFLETSRRGGSRFCLWSEWAAAKLEEFRIPSSPFQMSSWKVVVVRVVAAQWCSGWLSKPIKDAQSKRKMNAGAHSHITDAVPNCLKQNNASHLWNENRKACYHEGEWNGRVRVKVMLRSRKPQVLHCCL